MTEREAKEALKIVEREGREAIEGEPQGWRIYAALARVYQKAATLDPKYGELAGSYVVTATELAPETIVVSKVRAERQRIEDEEESAQDEKPE